MKISVFLASAASIAVATSAHAIPLREYVARSEPAADTAAEVAPFPGWGGTVDFKTEAGSQFARCERIADPQRFYQAKGDGCTSKASTMSRGTCVLSKNSCVAASKACSLYGGKLVYRDSDCLSEPMLPEWIGDVSFAFNGNTIGVCKGVPTFDAFAQAKDGCKSKSATSSRGQCDTPNNSCVFARQACRLYGGKFTAGTCQQREAFA